MVLRRTSPFAHEVLEVVISLVVVHFACWWLYLVVNYGWWLLYWLTICQPAWTNSWMESRQVISSWSRSWSKHRGFSQVLHTQISKQTFSLLVKASALAQPKKIAEHVRHLFGSHPPWGWWSSHSEPLLLTIINEPPVWFSSGFPVPIARPGTISRMVPHLICSQFFLELSVNGSADPKQPMQGPGLGYRACPSSTRVKIISFHHHQPSLVQSTNMVEDLEQPIVGHWRALTIAKWSPSKWLR